MGLTIALYGSCEKVEDGKFKFIISDNTKEATLVGSTGTPDVYLTIPSKCVYNGKDYIVTAIDSCAFKNCESIGYVSCPISLKKSGIMPFLIVVTLLQLNLIMPLSKSVPMRSCIVVALNLLSVPVTSNT